MSTLSGATADEHTQPRPVSLWEAFGYWLKLGFVSFGGPAGQISMMHTELVERRRWISEHRFLHALNYTMVLPGPEAQLRRRPRGCRRAVRHQTGSHCDCRVRRLPYRLARSTQWRTVGPGRGRFRSHLRAACALPLHRGGGGHHRLFRWPHRTRQVQGRRRSRCIGQDVRTGLDRRRHPGAKLGAF